MELIDTDKKTNSKKKNFMMKNLEKSLDNSTGEILSVSISFRRDRRSLRSAGLQMTLQNQKELACHKSKSL